MMNSVSEFVKRVITTLILLPLFLGAYLHSPLLFSLLLCAVLAIAMLVEWPKLIDTSNKKRFFIISFFYPILPVLGLILLDIWYRQADVWLPIYPFMVAWTADTFGYFFGKTWGRHKMCPTISPGKTWEGFAGSCLGVFALNYFIFPYIDVRPFQAFAKNIGIVFIVSLLVTTIAFLGGFFISFLKRRRELKDAGELLPGHGGILDRFDSVFFVIFFVWAMVLYPHGKKLTPTYLKTVPRKVIQKLFNLKATQPKVQEVVVDMGEDVDQVDEIETEVAREMPMAKSKLEEEDEDDDDEILEEVEDKEEETATDMPTLPKIITKELEELESMPEA